MTLSARIACDVAIVGAGPAGLSAAVEAGRFGRRVLVIEEANAAGGQIWRRASGGQAEGLRAEATRHGVGFHHGLTLVAADRTGAGRTLWCIRRDGGEAVRVDAARVVLATGARELLLPFPNWTLPGVFAAGGLQALSKDGFDVARKRIVVAGSGPLLMAVAAQLRARGGTVIEIAEQAPWRTVVRFLAKLTAHPAKLAQACALRGRTAGARYRTGTWPVRAEGDGRIEAVVLSDGTHERRIACDALAVGFGLVPNVQTAALLGCAIDDGAVRVSPNLETTAAGVFAAGEALGIGGVECARVEGAIAGRAAVDALTPDDPLLARRTRARRFARAVEEAFALRAELSALPAPDTLVCRCEDVTWARIRECQSWREAKLMTRCGMGPCQGRVCGPALRVLTGWSGGDSRPPSSPVGVDALRCFGVDANPTA